MSILSINLAQQVCFEPNKECSVIKRYILWNLYRDTEMKLACVERAY